jgi:hypothetical protein
MPYAPISNSTYVNFTGNGITSQTTAELAYDIKDPRLFNPGTDNGINVALILERNQDPTALLTGDWASRQQTLEQLNSTNSLWTTYGANPTLYKTVTDALKSSAYDLKLLDSSNSNYVSSAESRTIWLEIKTQADFQKLFQTPLFFSGKQEGIWYWNGQLSLPTEWKVAGIWFDTSQAPPASNMAPGVSVVLPHGAQSLGNSADPSLIREPQKIAAHYNFPLDGQSVQTGTIGLIEPGIGSALSDDRAGTAFQALLTEYLTKVERSGTGTVTVQGLDGQVFGSQNALERSLDVGVIAAVNPNSNLVLYNGSGQTNATGNAQASVFSAIQSAIWDTTNNPAVTTNSFGDEQAMAPGPSRRFRENSVRASSPCSTSNRKARLVRPTCCSARILPYRSTVSRPRPCRRPSPATSALPIFRRQRASCDWPARWRWPRRWVRRTIRSRSCGCVRTASTTCRSLSTKSTISPAA